MKYFALCAANCPIQFQLSIFAIILFSWFLFQQYRLSFDLMEQSFIDMHFNNNLLKEEKYDDSTSLWDDYTISRYTDYLSKQGYTMSEDDLSGHLKHMQSLHNQQTILEVLL